MFAWPSGGTAITYILLWYTLTASPNQTPTFIKHCPLDKTKMGTRHLILVWYRGRWQIAQYGQWDGYPEGQGAHILAFLQDRVKAAPARASSEAVGEQGRNITALKASLDKNLLYIPSQQELDQFVEDADHISSQAQEQMDERRNRIQSKSERKTDFTKDDELWDAIRSPMMLVQPSLTRDTGAQILSLVAHAKDRIAIQMSTEFIMDSVFCEWAYVVDLDKETFEVYSGITSRNDGEPDPRWENEEFMKGRGCKPRLLISFAFDNLKNLKKRRFIDAVHKIHKAVRGLDEEDEDAVAAESGEAGNEKGNDGEGADNSKGI